MDEFRFVMKCFLFSAALMALTQLKVGEGTVESKVQAGLTGSKTAEFINKAAEGGVKLINLSVEYAKDYYFKGSKEEVKPAVNVTVTEENKSAVPEAKADLDLEVQTEWSDEE